MSQVKANSFTDASGGSNAVLYGVAAPANSMGFRNRIINGDMRIDQRNAGASVTYSSNPGYPVDRNRFEFSQVSKITGQRSTTAPTGFSYSAQGTVAAAVTPGASDYFLIGQPIEGFNVADLGWGTASAQTVTLSFWVRSSVTGTYSLRFINGSFNRTYLTSYTISATNTWEQKTITLAGDTSGTWATDNTAGIVVQWDLGAGSNATSSTTNAWQAGNYQHVTGSVNWISTAGATFYITGVQLEAGSVASPFERRDYGRELMMCQRYCFVLAPSETNIRAATSGNYSGTTAYVTTYLPVSLRGSISVTVSSVSDFKTEELDGGQQTTTAIGLNAGNGNTPITLSVTVGSSLANPVNLLTGNTSAKITYSSEL